MKIRKKSNLDHADTTQRVCCSIQRLDSYLQNVSLECYDKLDFKEVHPFPKLISRRMSGDLVATTLLKMHYLAFAAAPKLMRRLFKVKPTLTASGLAFLAQGYLTCYENEKQQSYLDRAAPLLEKLRELNVGTSSMPSWGLPYDWQSFEVLPKDTPLGYTTVTCAEAFLMYARLTGDKDTLNWANRSCLLFYDELNHTEKPNKGVSLSYSPLDKSQVVNVSILSAGLMTEIDYCCRSTQHREFSMRLVRFALDSQNVDGGWYYDKDVTRIDSYHTAMVLQGLAKILLFGDVNPKLRSEIVEAVVRGLRFFLDRLWKSDIPANTTETQFPMEIMTPVEAMICFDFMHRIKNHLPDELVTLLYSRWKSTANWTFDNLQTRDGSFVTLYTPFRSIHLHSLRWGDGLMLRSLALTHKWLDSTDGN